MIRIPAILVALLLTLALDTLTLLAAPASGLAVLPAFLLPLSAALGGFVSARWARRPPPVPGFALGLLVVAVRVGVGSGVSGQPLLLAPPLVALLEVIAAIGGGVLGMVAARRAIRPAQPVEPRLRPLS